MAITPGTSYWGYPPDPSEYGSEGGVFVHEEKTVDGELLKNQRRLYHHVKHSPDGFSWGYAGSGPAELARCLLIDALGEDAQCKVCEGTGQVVYHHYLGTEMSVAEAEANYTSEDVDFAAVVTCSKCEDGCAVMPALYQQFKFDVIARLPMDEPWMLTRQAVLEWMASCAT